MSIQLKAKLEIKQTLFKDLEAEKQRYLDLKKKDNSDYYESCIARCDRLIDHAKKAIAEIENQLKASPLKQLFRPRLSGIEYRDNSR